MTRKVFCISMQRSGTTSVGDWLEAHGLKRAGWPVSSRNRWSELWAAGRLDEIFTAADFVGTEVFEDAPWWATNAYRVLAGLFPDARFILLERDADEWFRSLCMHSGGRNPGATDLHCLIYGRTAELDLLRQQGVDVSRYGLLDIMSRGEHYKAVYRSHNRSAAEYFQSLPGRLLHGSLDDPHVFDRILAFLGITRNPAVAPPRSNATTDRMRARLAGFIARSGDVS